MCTETAVATCVAFPAAGSALCEQTFCGGRLWRDGARSVSAYIPYRIHDPYAKFSPAYRDAIRASAEAWKRATNDLLTFEPCSPCFGRFVSIIPGDGDGIVEPTALEQVVPMPVSSDPQAPLPLHRIAHQWGHVIGLDDMYQRPDRDSFVRFDPAVWCGTGRPGIPARCAVDQTKGSVTPPLPSATFGVFDEFAKMNGLPEEGVCGAKTPDPRWAEPTVADASAALELYYGYLLGWSPLTPVGEPKWRDGRRDYQLAPGVDPVGVPAVASWTTPSFEIFVRGSDNKLYTIRNEVVGSGFTSWSDWTPVGDGFDSDPAVVFVAADILYLAARSSADGTIRLRAREAGAWGDWTAIPNPMGGTASAPALAGPDNYLNIFVFGNGGQLFAAFGSLPLPGTGGAVTFGEWQAIPYGFGLGRPNAWGRDGWMFYTVVGTDYTPWVNGWSAETSWGRWVSLHPGIEISRTDPEPSVGIAGPDARYFAPDRRGLIRSASRWEPSYVIGGLVSSSVGASLSRDYSRYDIAALVDDHGRPGVWWKYNSGVATGSKFVPPCNYNAPGACAVCGCGTPGAPSCDY
jgi:hypothetical protein